MPEQQPEQPEVKPVITIIAAAAGSKLVALLRAIIIFAFGIFCGMGIVLTHDGVEKKDDSSLKQQIEDLEKENQQLKDQLKLPIDQKARIEFLEKENKEIGDLLQCLGFFR